MHNPGLTKNYTASGAVTKHRIAIFGATMLLAAQAAAATSPLIGVFDELSRASGERVDVHHSGSAFVEYGGTVALFDPLTADADGKAVKATFDGSGKVYVVGFAMQAGVSGDVGSVMIMPHRIDPGMMTVPFFINQTDLLAPTTQEIIAPCTGAISLASGIVQVAVTTGGPITFKVGTTDVDGLTLTFADGATKGTIVSDTPTADHASTLVTKGQRIQVCPDAAFATAGAISGYVAITI